MTRRLYSIEQAAEELSPVVTVGWLRKHLSEVPHVKTGSGTGRAGRIGFTDEHLAEIVKFIEKRPAAPVSGPVTRRRSR